VLNKGFTAEKRDSHARDLSAAHPTATILSTYEIGTFVAFAARLDKGALSRELEHEDVQYIDANERVQLSADDTITQIGADWGLNRISQVNLSSDGTYRYYESAGQDVDAYVIDTGIYLNHEDLLGRAHFGANYIPNETNDDCNGHGTHVAGTIGGKTYGVAKRVTLWAVKVLSCAGSGAWTGVLDGIQWVVKHHSGRHQRSVANMSLGGGITQSIDDAVNAAVDQGVNMVVAAGNNNGLACNYSPARAAKAITVGATTNTDSRASFSNYGTCTDIFAPGNNIKSAWIGAPNATNTISGTSMAAPHVAGAVAIRLGHLAAVDPDSKIPSPAEVDAFLVSKATNGKIPNAGTGSPNKLLYSPFVIDGI